MFTYALEPRLKPHPSATFFQLMFISEFFMMNRVNLSISISEDAGGLSILPSCGCMRVERIERSQVKGVVQWRSMAGEKNAQR